MILGDEEYDTRALELEEACFSVIALQAPVAAISARVVSAIKIIADVERSADLCVNICKAARRIYGHELDPHLRGVIQKMGDQAQVLFKEATEAYLQPRRCPRRCAPRHGRLPGRPAAPVHPGDLREPRCRATIDLQVAVQLAVVARFYERIGDHAVNIGDRTRYIVNGWLPDHPYPESDNDPPSMASSAHTSDRRHDRRDRRRSWSG